MESNEAGNFSGREAFFANRRAVLIVVLAGILGACVGVRSARAAGPTKTAMDGVYTDDQAKRGKAEYGQSCSGCHMEDLKGSGQALPLAGNSFMDIWEGQSIGDLFDLVYTTMPQDKPGSLTPAATVDVITYLLQFNQFPSGKEELSNNPDTLKTIIITKKSSPK